MAKKLKRIAVIDFETDPFKYGREPRPFVAGFFDGEKYLSFWGRDCVAQIAKYLAFREPLLIYAHNGGKFDFYFLLEQIDNPVKIINGRIVTAAFLRRHEIRDSYAILPIPLEAYAKDKINYDIFESDVREKPHNKKAILSYLQTDCEKLYELVNAFCDRFGRKLTIGGTAINQLRERHPFPNTSEAHDKLIRPFYFGGRVQSFESGIVRAPMRIYDVNSMYPHVMKHYRHPIGERYITIEKPQILPDGRIKNYNAGGHPYFLQFEGENFGALPFRTGEGLDFNVRSGEFFATSHEIKVALQHKLVLIRKPIRAFMSYKSVTFDKFVDEFSAEKIAAKKSGNKAAEIFAKLILNSSYGKTGQNPENYFDWLLVKTGQDLPPEPWELYERNHAGSIWRKPIDRLSYYDVAIAASVTGAARAVLLNALCNTTRPFYCDTDSIICQNLKNVEIDAYKLGAWKLEDTGTAGAFAGKKLYAIYKGTECIKLASKGARIMPEQIKEIAQGATIKYFQDAPAFKLTGKATFIARRIKSRIKYPDGNSAVLFRKGNK